MLTDTQKNFRKQMTKLEDSMNQNNSNKGFYSYIEKDYINSYYEKKKKRKKIYATISIGGLLLFLWNSYAIYTWISPAFYSLTGKPLPTITKLLNVTNNKPKKAGHYLKEIHSIEEPLATYFQYRTDNLDNALHDRYRKKECFEIMKKYAEDIQSISFKLQSITPPKKFEQYHAITLSKLNISYQIFVYTLESLSSNDINNINNSIYKSNQLISKLNIINNQGKQEMIKIFNEIDMKYYELDGKIHYSWQE